MTMLVYMVGRNIPLYGIDIDAYSNVNVDAQSILLQAISGDMKNCSIFIIGLWPYMLASMLAILIVAIMSLDNTRKLSPKKINIWTVTIMMIIAAVQAYHKTQTLIYRVSGDELIWNKIIVFIQLIAGSDKNTNTQQYTSMLNRYILDNISYKLDAGLTLSDMQSAATVSDYLMLRVYQGLSRQRERIGDEEAYEQFVREATLKAVDDGWVELIDYLEQLKYAVAGRASAQRNVMFEYQNEAFESFLDTEKAVKCNIIRNILLSDVKIGKDGRLQVIYP